MSGAYVNSGLAKTEATLNGYDEAIVLNQDGHVAEGCVDHRPVGDGKVGPITTKIHDLYHRIVRGQAPAYRHWCAPVYQTTAQAV